MTQTNTPKLDVGDPFPHMTLTLVDGSKLILPDDMHGSWSVFLIYRGHWWVYCCQQLADFQKRLALFEKRNVKIIAGSTDDIENTTKTLEKYEISFPMAYGMNAEAFAKLTGVFYHPEKHYMHGAGFILRPDGTVGDAVYSTGPIGRYTAGECIGMIDYWLKQASQPQKTTETTG